MCWTFEIVTFLIFEITEVKKTTINSALIEAQATFKRNVLFRQWAASHGGFYVPITDQTPPNKYLEKIAERDISTPSGKKLTLMNLAYMTRQLHELGEKTNSVISIPDYPLLHLRLQH